MAPAAVRDEQEDELLARLDEKQAQLSTATEKLERCVTGPTGLGALTGSRDAELARNPL